ncbi:MAG: hypothetical protein AAFR76_05350, partial [Planctomycetota bacterium]
MRFEADACGRAAGCIRVVGVVLAFAGAVAANAETTFTEDVLVADGDVLVIDDFTTFEGELRIEGGGLVLVNPGNWTINIEGSLVIAGEEGNPAVIRSVDGDWNGIDIDFGATGSIAWAEIDASNATTISVFSGPVTIENTTIADPANLSNPSATRQAVFAQAGPVSIDRCTFGPMVGRPGADGNTAGNPGEDGGDGGDVEVILGLNLDDLSVTRSRFVGIVGGDGGRGVTGQPGMFGAPGQDAAPGSGNDGQDGQPGAPGGGGGRGGDGGDVNIVRLSRVGNPIVAQNIIDRPRAGTGGQGGAGGQGGRGGRGGDGGNSGILDGGDGGDGGAGGRGGDGGDGGASGRLEVVRYDALFVSDQQTGTTRVAHNTVYNLSSGLPGQDGPGGTRGTGGPGGDGGGGGAFGSDGADGAMGPFGTNGVRGADGPFTTASGFTFFGAGTGTASIHNNIWRADPVSSLLGTTVAIIGEPTLTSDARSNVFAGFDQLSSGASPAGLAGTITMNPPFDDVSLSDFRPIIGSFLVDGGDNSVTPAGIEEDFFGNPRFMDEPSTPTTGPGGQFAVDFGAVERLGDTPGPACLADVNGDGVANPADFNAWVAAFASQAPGCDQNGDGLCNPADF